MLKAAVILATGDQPPFLFELAPIAVAIALQGLFTRVVRPSGIRRTALQSAIVAIAVAAIVSVAIGPEENEQSGLLELLSSLADVVSGLGPAVVLIVLGRSVMKRQLWAGYWRFLPVALGIGFVPAIIIGAILETSLGERFLEVPLLLIGLAWMLIGYQLWLHEDSVAHVPSQG